MTDTFTLVNSLIATFSLIIILHEVLAWDKEELKQKIEGKK